MSFVDRRPQARLDPVVRGALRDLFADAADPMDGDLAAPVRRSGRGTPSRRGVPPKPRRVGKAEYLGRRYPLKGPERAQAYQRQVTGQAHETGFRLNGKIVEVDGYRPRRREIVEVKQSIRPWFVDQKRFNAGARQMRSHLRLARAIGGKVTYVVPSEAERKLLLDTIRPNARIARALDHGTLKIDVVPERSARL